MSGGDVSVTFTYSGKRYKIPTILYEIHKKKDFSLVLAIEGYIEDILGCSLNGNERLIKLIARDEGHPIRLRSSETFLFLMKKAFEINKCFEIEVYPIERSVPVAEFGSKSDL